MELLERVSNIEKDLMTIKLDVGIIKATMATKADLAELKGDNTLIKWMMGVLIALALANFAKQFF